MIDVTFMYKFMDGTTITTNEFHAFSLKNAHKSKSSTLKIIVPKDVWLQFGEYANVKVIVDFPDLGEKTIFYGGLVDRTARYENNRIEYTLNFVDVTHSVFSYLQGKTYTAPVNILIRNFVEDMSSQTHSEWGQISDYDIASTRIDGSAFPTVRYVWDNRPLSSVLDELSTPAYTGDKGTYYTWWIDEDRVFHWQPISRLKDTFTWNIDLSEYYSITPSIGLKGVVNQVIVYGGLDLNNNPIYVKKDDIRSISIYGVKSKLISYPSIADKLKKLYEDDINNGTLDNEEFRRRVKNIALIKADQILEGYKSFNVAYEFTIPFQFVPIGAKLNFTNVPQNINELESYDLYSDTVEYVVRRNKCYTVVRAVQEGELR